MFYEMKSGFEKITTCMDGFSKRIEAFASDINEEKTKGKIDIRKDIIKRAIIVLCSAAVGSALIYGLLIKKLTNISYFS